MKNNPFWKLVKETVLVLFLFWTLVLFTFLLPYNKQYGYAQMLESCGKSDWLYQRIFKNKTPIDIALIGSSRTLCGIQDSLLEDQLSRNQQQFFHVANLGFCRYGRPLHTSIIKDLFEHHHPKAIILEVRETESRFSHPDFPYMANTNDLLLPYLHESYFKQVLKGARSRMEFNLKKILNCLPKYDTSKVVNNYFYFKNKDNDDDTSLNQRTQMDFNKTKHNTGFYWQFYFSKNQVKEIVAIAKKNNAHIYFLFLPSYRSHFTQPFEAEFYLQYGELLTPPKSLLDRTDIWSDEVHLNPKGAAELTGWLSEKIHEI